MQFAANEPGRSASARVTLEILSTVSFQSILSNNRIVGAYLSCTELLYLIDEITDFRLGALVSEKGVRLKAVPKQDGVKINIWR